MHLTKCAARLIKCVFNQLAYMHAISSRGGLGLGIGLQFGLGLGLGLGVSVRVRVMVRALIKSTNH